MEVSSTRSNTEDEMANWKNDISEVSLWMNQVKNLELKNVSLREITSAYKNISK